MVTKAEYEEVGSDGLRGRFRGWDVGLGREEGGGLGWRSVRGSGAEEGDWSMDDSS